MIESFIIGTYIAIAVVFVVTGLDELPAKDWGIVVCLSICWPIAVLWAYTTDEKTALTIE